MRPLGPLDPFGGVPTAIVRECLAFEAASGRGPDSPDRLQQVEDERRELIRLAAHYRANPRLRPWGWVDPEVIKLEPAPEPAKPCAKAHSVSLPLFDDPMPEHVPTMEVVTR